MRYAPSQKTGKPKKSKVFGRKKPKDNKEDSQIQL